MLNRREFLGRGLAALSVAAAYQARCVLGQPSAPCVPTGGEPLWSTGPVRFLPHLGPCAEVGGLPFSLGWYGDYFPNTLIPFHGSEELLPGGAPPVPQESVDIAIVGGGLSGLTMAYLLRGYRPVVFELQPRFGGTSQGEFFGGETFSLGGAYFITPDEGSYLEGFYRELGVDRMRRESPSSDDPTELNGSVVPDFWSGHGLPPQERDAFAQYAALVQRYVDQYPEIPLEEGADNGWILDLDRKTLRDHITGALTVPVPTLLRSAIQAYCYSSFNAGWDEVSAASGINFIAAEEFGRWVLPGGNAGLVAALWSRLVAMETNTPRHCPPRHLRAGCRVVDVRVLGQDRCQVTWRDGAGAFRSLVAKRVVVCSPKHPARHFIHGFEQLEFDQYQATYQINSNAYVVANVLLDRPVHRRFYDLFLLRDGLSPDGPDGVEAYSRVTDAVNGGFALHPSHGRVLTLYWPLPFTTGRFTLIDDAGWQAYAERFATQIRTILDVLDMRPRDVRQVRMARWGHSMPVAAPNFIARGFPQVLRRPFQDHVFFSHQDNWCLPAVETCLLEAAYQAPRVAEGL
ncbi:MAG: NAD(P)-binding protein [Phycisphaerales bacterium]